MYLRRIKLAQSYVSVMQLQLNGPGGPWHRYRSLLAFFLHWAAGSVVLLIQCGDDQYDLRSRIALKCVLVDPYHGLEQTPTLEVRRSCKAMDWSGACLYLEARISHNTAERKVLSPTQIAAGDATVELLAIVVLLTLLRTFIIYRTTRPIVGLSTSLTDVNVNGTGAWPFA